MISCSLELMPYLCVLTQRVGFVYSEHPKTGMEFFFIPVPGNFAQTFGQQYLIDLAGGLDKFGFVFITVRNVFFLVYTNLGRK